MGEIGEIAREIKENRKRLKQKREKQKSQKQKQQQKQQHRRCWDWIAVSGSCHYARNRSSFKEYRQVGKTVKTGVISPELLVYGVGTVELKVRSSPKEGSPTRTLVLGNVLHIPTAICNGFCFAKHPETRYGSTILNPMMQSFDAEGRPLWYTEEFYGVSRLVLDGNPQGETYLSDGPKFLSMHIGTEDLEEILS